MDRNKRTQPKLRIGGKESGGEGENEEPNLATGKFVMS